MCFLPISETVTLFLIIFRNWETFTVNFAVDTEHNVLYLVMGHPLVMGHYFHFVKSNKTYNNSLTIHQEKLIFE